MPQGHPVYASMQTTIFEHMSGLSRELGAINLGQGFPDGHGPMALREAAARALIERSSQYPPSVGLPELRSAVAGFYNRRQNLDLTPGNVVITSGATEAIAVAVMALVQPGDEVILFAPAYDAYAPMVRRCGGVPRGGASARTARGETSPSRPPARPAPGASAPRCWWCRASRWPDPRR